MIGWRAWCADGSTCSSAERAWRDLPSEGVVGVVEYHDPPYRDLHTGHDWIWLNEDGFGAVKMHPEPGRWAEAPEGVAPGALKRGANVPDEDWDRMRREMMEARTWP